MRSLLLALALAVLAIGAPAAARADLGLGLRLEQFDGPRDRAAAVHLDLPALEAKGVPSLDVGSLALDEGGGAGRHHGHVEPAVALILGIIPGFGIGHLVAGSDQWVYWLIADLVIFIIWPGGLFFTSHDAYNFLGLLVLVERVFEGISAFQAAGGGPVFRSQGLLAEAPLPAPRELALPVVARAALAP